MMQISNFMTKSKIPVDRLVYALENITPKEKANTVWSIITGSIHKNVSVTGSDVISKKHTAKPMDIQKITNFLLKMKHW